MNLTTRLPLLVILALFGLVVAAPHDPPSSPTESKCQSECKASHSSYQHCVTECEVKEKEGELGLYTPIGLERRSKPTAWVAE
jgi:hypothetical protein